MADPNSNDLGIHDSLPGPLRRPLQWDSSSSVSLEYQVLRDVTAFYNADLHSCSCLRFTWTSGAGVAL